VEPQQRFARYAAYYQAMAELAASAMTDVIAHPDFIKVCCYDDFQAWLAQPGSLDRVAAALEAMRATDTAMEVSSAGLRKSFHEPYPGPAIMRLAADLGLALSFGSDAHNTADTVSHFDELAAYAASFGFTKNRICVERERRELQF
jgi:histidinol-phosphatase (PHP family)